MMEKSNNIYNYMAMRSLILFLCFICISACKKGDIKNVVEPTKNITLLEEAIFTDSGIEFKKSLFLVKNIDLQKFNLPRNNITETKTILGVFQGTEHLNDLKEENIQDWRDWSFRENEIEYRNLLIHLKNDSIYFLQRKYTTKK